MAALVGAGPLLRKIYFPPFAPVLGNAVATLLQTAIELGLLLVVFVFAWNVGWTLLLLPFLLVLLGAFSLGVGLLLAMLNAPLPRRQLHRAGRAQPALLRDADHLPDRLRHRRSTTSTRGCGSTSSTR